MEIVEIFVITILYLFASFMKGMGPQIQHSLRSLSLLPLAFVSIVSFFSSVDGSNNTSGSTSCNSDNDILPNEYLPTEIVRNSFTVLKIIHFIDLVQSKALCYI